METNTLIIIYVLLLVMTIVLVVMKKTHWGSIIGVALMPIYFIWVLLDAVRSPGARKQEEAVPDETNKNEGVEAASRDQNDNRTQREVTPDGVKEMIREKLQKADSRALQGTNTIIAVAILYENPRNMALPEKHMLAQKLVEQYKPQGWIPGGLSVDQRTPVAARQLIHGQEIREDAGLDTAGSNVILAGMLADLKSATDIDGTSAIAFSGDSVALGQTFFAVLAK
jgi:hypothetical protein